MLGKRTVILREMRHARLHTGRLLHTENHRVTQNNRTTLAVVSHLFHTTDVQEFFHHQDRQQNLQPFSRWPRLVESAT